MACLSSTVDYAYTPLPTETRTHHSHPSRRDRRDGLEVRRSFSSPKYPAYYLQNFHYQTDGWMSAKSAQLYDYQVQ